MKKKRNLIIVSAVILIIAIAAVVFFANFVISPGNIHAYKLKTEIGDATVKIVKLEGSEKYVAHLEIFPKNGEIATENATIDTEDIAILFCDVMALESYTSPTELKLNEILTLGANEKNGKFVSQSFIQYTPFDFVTTDQPIEIGGFISNPHIRFVARFAEKDYIVFENPSKEILPIMERDLYQQLRAIKP